MPRPEIIARAICQSYNNLQIGIPIGHRSRMEKEVAKFIRRECQMGRKRKILTDEETQKFLTDHDGKIIVPGLTLNATSSAEILKFLAR